MKKKTRAGLTLVELLVVLVILAIVTAIAVQSTESVIDQGRYDATQRTLQNIQNAIIGPANQRAPDGSQLMTGFVADMGRLPQPVYVGGAISGDPLRELWDPAAITLNSGTAYSVSPVTVPSASSSQTGAALLKTTSTTNLQVTIPSGWRGPYLQLAVGSTSPVDGWGNALQSIFQSPGAAVYPPPSPPPAGFPINAVCSLGIDNAFDIAIPTNPYAQDQYVPAQPAVPPSVPLVNFSQLAYGTVTVTVQSINTNVTPTALTNPYPTTETSPKVRIVLFAPVNGLMTTFIMDSTSGPSAYNPNPTPATYLSAGPYYPLYSPNPTPVDFALTTGTPPPTTPVSGSFFNVPIGARAIQAFQYEAAPGTNNMVVTKRSPLTFLMVPAGGLPSQTLILQ